MYDTTSINSIFKKKEDYTGKTTYHNLRCGCYLITYKAQDSITLRRHKQLCKGKGKGKGKR